MAWIQCPRKYKLMFIEKAEKQNVLPALPQGRWLHSFFNVFFDKIVPEELLKKTDLSNTLGYFRSLVPSIEENVVRSAVQNFIEFEANEWINLRGVPDPLRYFVPIAREKVFIVKEREEGSFLGRAGHVDRIDRMLDENLIVIDYKPRIGNLSSMRRELCFYQELVNASHLYDKRVTHWGCFGYRQKQVFAEPSNPRTRTAMYKQIARMKKSILENDYPMKVSDNCVTCWFNYLCVWEMKEVEETQQTEKESSE